MKQICLGNHQATGTHRLVSEEQSAESSETERKNFWDCWLDEGRRREEEEGEMEDEEEGRNLVEEVGRRAEEEEGGRREAVMALLLLFKCFFTSSCSMLPNSWIPTLSQQWTLGLLSLHNFVKSTKLDFRLHKDLC